MQIVVYTGYDEGYVVRGITRQLINQFETLKRNLTTIGNSKCMVGSDGRVYYTFGPPSEHFAVDCQPVNNFVVFSQTDGNQKYLIRIICDLSVAPGDHHNDTIELNGYVNQTSEFALEKALEFLLKLAHYLPG